MITKTWLPLFSGFYNTIWDDDDRTREDIKYQLESDDYTEGLLLSPERVKFIEDNFYGTKEYDESWIDYTNQVVSGMVEAVESALNSTFGLNLCFSSGSLVSPREYNFTNDSINIDVKYTKLDKKIIKEYILANIESFTVYIKNGYTSYDGFSSYHSNNAIDWLAFISLNLKDMHKMGSILEWMLKNENIYEESLEIEAFQSVFLPNVYHELANHNEWPMIKETRGVI